MDAANAALACVKCRGSDAVTFDIVILSRKTYISNIFVRKISVCNGIA